MKKTWSIIGRVFTIIVVIFTVFVMLFTIITVGTDSHTSDRVGEHVEDVLKHYHDIGFEDVTTFTKRVKDN